MLMTTCDAPVGVSITHQMTRAIASHPAILLAFTLHAHMVQGCPEPDDNKDGKQPEDPPVPVGFPGRDPPGHQQQPQDNPSGTPG